MQSSSPVTQIVDSATAALQHAARDTLAFEEVARWCVETGGVDPRLEHAALVHARRVVSSDAVVADVAAKLRARLVAAGPMLPSLVAQGGVARVLASLATDDAHPAPEAIRGAVSPRIARFYWHRLRGFVAWSASTTMVAAR